MKTIVYLVLAGILLGCKKDEKVEPGEPALTRRDLLSADKYQRLVIEIVSVEGFSPSEQSITALKSFAEQHLNKPSGIEMIHKTIPSSGKTIYSLSDLRSLEDAHRKEQTSGNTITAYVFFADADYDQNSGNSKVLGIAYGFSSMVIFEKTINGLSGGLGQPSKAVVETSVLNHEFGHTLGLVNNGTAMSSKHQDEAHGRHCLNAKCLMYYATETSDIIANLLGNGIPVLDENCVNDLKANGGK